MKVNKSVKLDLLENSQSFLIEAVDKAIGAEDEVRHWQFAILNLVQSLELSLKLILKNIHPLFIYENIDNPKNTVSVTKAIDRLSNPNIGNISFIESEKKGMNSAIKLRNQITHSEFELSVDYAQAQFFKVFSLIATVQRRHFDTQVEDILSAEAIENLVFLEKSKKILVNNALQRIEEEGIEQNFLWSCPNCLSDTFVVHDEIDTCYVCTYTESVKQCPHCQELCLEEELESIHNSFDIDYCEGQAIIHNSYGFDDLMACSECAPRIAQEIEERRAHEEMQEQEYYHWLNEA
ncbi:DUF4145 domain-containing protein [Vibrio crassostreae]|uniref:hypothetical protein n=1 Tax=Vibrio crassostreae TaxID=246167 RepID=UPI001BD6AB6D|nr:hypothetical protein [Vibrio crassostreae]CAK1724170.1 DUF4145 domain-containing protein [Vibrio crassostreae]CAK1941279.1 DUF4145 domain-containing protein [Vibrio crassostreae]CAK2324740.1 DUF4145 domain-containing protein [Vibrio crassostreae]CAK2331792.1 DUF4145 domain-containing protein [Vibrio crassostreae]CAK2390276.1 DUF4145 domain-containing protein [Vibrio crassostreae]